MLFLPLVDPVTVTVSPYEIPTAGESFSLICTVSLAEGDSLIGAVQWMGPDGVPVSRTHQTKTNIYISTLEFNPVMTSHGGEYICQATSSAGTMMDATLLTVQSEHRVFVMRGKLCDWQASIDNMVACIALPELVDHAYIQISLHSCLKWHMQTLEFEY